jgi:hypothetical protein
MDAVLRLHLSESTEKSISRIKDIFSKASGKNDPELIISLSAHSENSGYFEKLDASIKQYEEGNMVSFTMESLKENILIL